MMFLCFLGQQVHKAGSFLGHVEGSFDGSMEAVGNRHLHAAFSGQ